MSELRLCWEEKPTGQPTAMTVAELLKDLDQARVPHMLALQTAEVLMDRNDHLLQPLLTIVFQRFQQNKPTLLLFKDIKAMLRLFASGQLYGFGEFDVDQEASKQNKLEIVYRKNSEL